jgi:hypothetical protein
MKESHTLALIVAYYLSKYDKEACRNLGFSTSSDAHKEIGRVLGVNPNSIKNMRDEFDPLHDNPRVGWYQRPLRPSRAKVVESFQDLGEEALRDVVLEILKNPEFKASEDFSDIVQPISKRENSKKRKSLFILRGPTGRKAEEFFIRFHQSEKHPVSGVLQDLRDYGCGYDFEIRTENEKYQIEVKGLDKDTGGIVFTSKEWDTAKAKGDTYFLAIVRNVSSTPEIQFIRNPGTQLTAKRNIFTTVQVRWSINDSELGKIE